ncbi:transmembrane protein 273 isoform X2 [Engystomops pustulosus]|uniref:transmembrane protein 273 isoform X2 n=1 Tax=Engystomops pustulosus TaxID=76066 RepID=UPI003AFA271C
MIMGTNNCLKPLAFIPLFLSFAHCNGKPEEGFDIQYVIIGVCLGAVFSVAFIAIKLYMIKKHMLDNSYSDMEMEIPPEKIQR